MVPNEAIVQHWEIALQSKSLILHRKDEFYGPVKILWADCGLIERLVFGESKPGTPHLVGRDARMRTTSWDLFPELADRPVWQD